MELYRIPSHFMNHIIYIEYYIYSKHEIVLNTRDFRRVSELRRVIYNADFKGKMYFNLLWNIYPNYYKDKWLNCIFQFQLYCLRKLLNLHKITFSIFLNYLLLFKWVLQHTQWYSFLFPREFFYIKYWLISKCFYKKSKLFCYSAWFNEYYFMPIFFILIGWKLDCMQLNLKATILALMGYLSFSVVVFVSRVKFEKQFTKASF